ncbi:hypothetical protein Clacol_009367 [Clathrus columnatus]|uniref:Uncharacterized protein n=1 Tax=Clathrus columnatus TaxID=1419009 RepID=A0AAV5AKA5_9AGAM|nr:hypothetical protein Clacol_009367 [Clathrus columnatus]
MDFVLSAEDNMVFNVTLPTDAISARTICSSSLIRLNLVLSRGLGSSGFFLQDSHVDNTAEVEVSLTYETKSLVGGWRFLTYFGRARFVNGHEETIGDCASFINIVNGMPELGDTPFYDYKLIRYSTIPFNVNVPSALRALSRLTHAGILELEGIPHAGSRADEYAEVGEQRDVPLEFSLLMLKGT